MGRGSQRPPVGFDDGEGPPRASTRSITNSDAFLAFHELQHTHASGLVSRGVPLVFVAMRPGHRDTILAGLPDGPLCQHAFCDSGFHEDLLQHSATDGGDPGALR